MISANDVMRKIQRDDDWVTVYDMKDDYDLEASASYLRHLARLEQDPTR